MNRAIIMEIQRYCIHDGPGIRTTVFFKGCHMKCGWCHNPESQAKEPEMMFFESSCIHCRQCEVICQSGAHYFTDKSHKIRLELCKDCGKQEQCQEICCTNSFKLCGKSMKVEEVFREIMRDRGCYGELGGVTFSGGEPLLQHDYLKEIMRCCKQAGISVCLDTTLNVEWDIVESITPYTDLYLIDLKCMDENLHIAMTGVSNKNLLVNLKRLSDLGVRMIIRMPIIEGVNDSVKEMKERKTFLQDIRGLERIDMIPVSNYGSVKYKALGKGIPQYNKNIDLDKLFQ
ncbi:MAG TPA: glycyl-radical enzyme activating protein [Mobilitalea sp.]|nr:glycyl-radical enzyme activating protein [Mobilitalea sp.]